MSLTKDEMDFVLGLLNLRQATEDVGDIRAIDEFLEIYLAKISTVTIDENGIINYE